MVTRVEAHTIWTELQSQRELFVDKLREFVAIESPSTDKTTIPLVFDFISKELSELGYAVLQVPGIQTGGYLFARPLHKTKNAPLQMLIGHADTVWPTGTLSRMPVKVDMETISGPGVYDMKGGVMQLIFALRTLQKLDLQPEVLPLVLINGDEEIGSRESTHIIRLLAKISNRAFVMEPSLGYEGKLKTGRKGVGRFQIKITGEAAHAGLDPGKGASAIVELSHVIQRLFELNNVERGVSVNVGMIEGGVRPNVIAPTSEAVIDVRVPTQDIAVEIERKIKNIQPANPMVKLEITGQINRPPMEQDAKNQALWELAKKNGENMGIALQQAIAGGGSDGNTTSQFIPTLDGLGATGDGAHAAHEFAFIDKMMERSALLASLLMEPPL
jgi:glutamate carboxypeptidase